MIKRIRAFTLLEITTVIVIIGLMAAFALPNYTKAITKADERTAIANLMAIRAAVNMYLANTNTTIIPNMPNISALNTTLGIGIVDPKFAYNCLGVEGGHTNDCDALHPSGWRIHFHNSGIHNLDQSIHCVTTGGPPPCPSCPNSGTGDCG
jgi:prepilin-type N-terminal cleavage/methylation domain-containing protein